MKILIIGSRGFIGSNLVAFFTGKGHEVYGCDVVEYSTTEYLYQKLSVFSADFETVFEGKGIDVCVNAAGSGSVPYSIEHPLNDFEANVLTVARILDTIRKQQPSCKYVHISSAAVYGNPVQLPVGENERTDPLSPYGFHKLISEMSCREYQQLYDLPVAIIRPFSVYGPGLRKQLFWDICSRLKKADAITLYGTGKESRDFLHITDLALLIEKIIDKSPFKCDIYNAASGIETSISEVAMIFENHFPSNKKISFSGEAKKGDPINWKANTDRIQAIGFRSTTELRPAIADYIKWYCSLP